MTISGAVFVMANLRASNDINFPVTGKLALHHPRSCDVRNPDREHETVPMRIGIVVRSYHDVHIFPAGGPKVGKNSHDPFSTASSQTGNDVCNPYACHIRSSVPSPYDACGSGLNDALKGSTASLRSPLLFMCLSRMANGSIQRKLATAKGRTSCGATKIPIIETNSTLISRPALRGTRFPAVFSDKKTNQIA